MLGSLLGVEIEMVGGGIAHGVLPEGSQGESS